MTCPVCGKPEQAKHKPFCSDRCRIVDLGRWLNGSYAVPAVEDDELPDDLIEDESNLRS